jgi:hypothetical protein
MTNTTSQSIRLVDDTTMNSYRKWKTDANYKTYCKYRKFCDWRMYCHTMKSQENPTDRVLNWKKLC